MARILVVDDEIYIRELIKKALSSLGHRVFEAENGEQAMEVLRSHQFDLAIVDLVMPHKGGIETLVEVRDSDKGIKLIAISGKIQTDKESIQNLAQQFKVDRVLSKPFDVNDLIELVQILV